MAIPTYTNPPSHPSRSEGSDQLAFNQKAERWLNWVFNFFKNGGEFREILVWISRQLSSIKKKADDAETSANRAELAKSKAESASSQAKSAWYNIQSYIQKNEITVTLEEIESQMDVLAWQIANNHLLAINNRINITQQG